MGSRSNTPNIDPALELRRFAESTPELARLIDGLSAAQLDATPIPGKWSLRQLAMHLLDAEIVTAHRLRLVAATGAPTPAPAPGKETSSGMRDPGAHAPPATLEDGVRLGARLGIPMLPGWDQDAFLRELPPALPETPAVCAAFEAVRGVSVATLRALPREAFDRRGIHARHGVVTLARLLQLCNEHFEHHLHHAREKRAALVGG